MIRLSSSDIVLIVAVFLASAVEMIEALTIVMAAGVSRGWRSALEGTAVAVASLAVLVATLGAALVAYVPLSDLRLVVGAVLLVFGMQWLRKAVLRASGYKDKHDEDAIYAATVNRLSRDQSRHQGRDSVGFAVAFKGVFLEGLEVVIVVLTLGAANHRLALAASAATAAVAIVAALGLILARHLSGIPENAMKMGVGLMLVSFGSFWSGEGLGVMWPGADLAIPGLVAFYGLTTAALVATLQKSKSKSRTASA